MDETVKAIAGAIMDHDAPQIMRAEIVNLRAQLHEACRLLRLRDPNTIAECDLLRAIDEREEE